MIPVYIGSSSRFECVERLTAASILENSTAAVDIRVVRPEWYGMEPTGCTGFTNVRFAVPELLRMHGHEFGIYLDVDMIVLGDIAELFGYQQVGRAVGLIDGSSEVAVFHRAAEFPPIDALHHYKKTQLVGRMTPAIPLEWNCEDRCGGKILHFTDLGAQPWFYDHPDSEAVAVYEQYLAASESLIGNRWVRHSVN